MRFLPARHTMIVGLSAVLGLGCAATAVADSRDNAAPVPSAAQAHQRPPAEGDVAGAFRAVTRDTAWRLTGKLRLDFPTYHTEGMAVAGERVFLSAVQVLEPTRKYPAPQGGYDRTPGRGVGHVFVMDRRGHLQRDIILGEGDAYHPAGVDFDGASVWVPVAQYRPNGGSIIYRIDALTLAVHKQFEVEDHIGGIIRDPATGHLIGNNWGSRRFYEWERDGRQLDAWDNTSHFIDYQDCQHLADRKMICGGVTNLPQAPAGGAGGTYELGGIGMVDLHDHRVLHEVPFQQWSSAGHVATRNPFKIVADGNRLTLSVAPDNGDEGNGTDILTYQATVDATPGTDGTTSRR
jgi:hypothetical protein